MGDLSDDCLSALETDYETQKHSPRYEERRKRDDARRALERRTRERRLSADGWDMLNRGLGKSGEFIICGQRMAPAVPVKVKIAAKLSINLKIRKQNTQCKKTKDVLPELARHENEALTKKNNYESEWVSKIKRVMSSRPTTKRKEKSVLLHKGSRKSLAASLAEIRLRRSSLTCRGEYNVTARNPRSRQVFFPQVHVQLKWQTQLRSGGETWQLR